MNSQNFNKALGAVIRKHRLSQGKTMQAVAKIIGFSYQQQYKNEVGSTGCTAHLVAKYAEIFGVTVATFYEEAGLETGTPTPSEADSAGFLAARYVSRIKDSHVRATVVDFARKLAYRGAAV